MSTKLKYDKKKLVRNQETSVINALSIPGQNHANVSIISCVT